MSPAAPRRAVVLAMVIGLLAVQLIALYLPRSPGPPSPIPHSDKLIHALVFAAPILAGALAKGRTWLIVAIACAVHAPVSEVIQHIFLAHRSGDVWDVVADLVGICGALAGVSWWIRRPRRRRP